MEQYTRSPLKYPGGKYKSLSKILPHLGESRRLIEPFCGGASVTLNTDYDCYFLSDVNFDLIYFYECIAQDGDKFLGYLQEVFWNYPETAESYYKIRTRFNAMLTPNWTKAAFFFWLNRRGFNGLVRYNQKGEYNVPYGNYARPVYPLEELQVLAQKLQRTILTPAGFGYAMSLAGKDDTIYCDPPYLGTYSGYYGSEFDYIQHRRLLIMAQRAAAKGAKVIISNIDTPETRELYKGMELVELTNYHSISRKGSSRGQKKELLVVLGD